MGDMTYLPREQLCRCPIQLRTVRKQTLEYVLLRESIRRDGILQPLMVRPGPGDKYEVVLGTHRYEISCDLKMEMVPVLIRETTDEQVEAYQIVENDVNVPTQPTDRALRLQSILNRGEMTLSELAAKVSRHPDTIKKWLSLNFLSPECKKALDSRQISCILGIELAKLPLTKQTELLSLHSQFNSQEYLEVLRQAVREHRGIARSERGRAKSGITETFRQFRKVKDEHLNPTEAATVLFRKAAETPLDGWKAALEWVLSMDESTVREREARLKRDIALKLKRTESRNLESKERQSYEQ